MVERRRLIKVHPKLRHFADPDVLGIRVVVCELVPPEHLEAPYKTLQSDACLSLHIVHK